MHLANINKFLYTLNSNVSVVLLVTCGDSQTEPWVYLGLLGKKGTHVAIFAT